MKPMAPRFEVSRSHKLDKYIHPVGLKEWWVRRRILYLRNTKQAQETNIHDHGGIGTRDANNQEAANLRLRPHS